MHTWNRWSLTLSELLKGLLHVHLVAKEHLVNAEPDALGSLNIYTAFTAFCCKSPSNGLILKEHVTNCLSLLLLGGRRVLPSSRGNSAKEELCGSKLWNLQNFQWPKRNCLFSLIGFCSLSFSAHCISLNKNMVDHSCTDFIWNDHPCPPPPPTSSSSSYTLTLLPLAFRLCASISDINFWPGHEHPGPAYLGSIVSNKCEQLWEVTPTL